MPRPPQPCLLSAAASGYEAPPKKRWAAWLLHREHASLVRASDGGRRRVLSSDHTDPLVELARDVGGRAHLEKGDPVLLASAEHAPARLLHLSRVRLTRHLRVVESQTAISTSHLATPKPPPLAARIAI